jgi:hypothetical protein
MSEAPTIAMVLTRCRIAELRAGVGNGVQTAHGYLAGSGTAIVAVGAG